MFPLAEVQSFTIFVSVKSCFPLFFPLSSGICFPYGFVELLHSGGAVPFHFLGDMTVHIQCESGCAMNLILFVSMIFGIENHGNPSRYDLHFY